MLPGGVPLKQQSVNVVLRILPPILVQDNGLFSKAHRGKSIVLRNHNVAGCDAVNQRKIYAVCAFVKNQGLSPFSAEGVGGVA